MMTHRMLAVTEPDPAVARPGRRYGHWQCGSTTALAPGACEGMTGPYRRPPPRAPWARRRPGP
eukprot:440932-Hanusia_phi.AAC.1